MYKSLESNNDKFAEENKFSYHAPVILCLVPRILWKQGINLVNKFALLLNKCWLREDSWDKPKNDWCWERWLSVFTTSAFNVILRRYSLPKVLGRRIHNVIAKAMSICVAYSNKVMDTPELPQPIKRHVAPKYDSCSIGRSMIEMLGVLAIIAVLSVGGIAGYSKAMEKFKLNKLMSEYSMFLYNLTEHEEELHKMAHNLNKTTNITDTIQAMNIVPDTWQTSQRQIYDRFGNYVTILGAPMDDAGQFDRISLFIYLGGFSSTGTTESFSVKACSGFFTDLIIPLKDVIYNVHLYRRTASFTASWYGTASCSTGRKCLSNMTLSDIRNLCSMCDKENDACSINFNL